MTVTADAAGARPAPRLFVPSGRLLNAGLALVVFLGGFVIIEPAPYELLLIALMAVWLFAGLRVTRYVLPLIVLLLLYLAGGAIALANVETLSKPLVYFGTTMLLAFSAFFFATIIPADPERRLLLIMRAYTWSAVIASAVGVAGYALGIEFFTLYDRARGPFQDPNVFAPFLVMPLCYLAHQTLTQPLRKSFWHVVGALIITLAVVLAFSRAAWAMAALALAVTATVAFINNRSGRKRLRILTYIGFGAVAIVAIVAVLLILPATSGLFLERAQLVQSYDAGALGRFDRQQLGFLLLFDHPFGIGPFEFGKLFVEDEHNMWLKGFTVYGWLGGLSYIALVVWTLVIGFPLMFRPRPWRVVVIAAFSAYLGQVLIHNVIDNDHWRHLFLLYGVIWGAYAAERLHRRKRVVPTVRVFTARIERATHGT
ncbi:MAG: hypothetical protein KIT43_12785 [Bauldia sp.]|nr:hypothetical protein [Bauldia sp.]